MGVVESAWRDSEPLRPPSQFPSSSIGRSIAASGIKFGFLTSHQVCHIYIRTQISAPIVLLFPSGSSHFPSDTSAFPPSALGSTFTSSTQPSATDPSSPPVPAPKSKARDGSHWTMRPKPATTGFTPDVRGRSGREERRCHTHSPARGIPGKCEPGQEGVAAMGRGSKVTLATIGWMAEDERKRLASWVEQLADNLWRRGYGRRGPRFVKGLGETGNEAKRGREIRRGRGRGEA